MKELTVKTENNIKAVMTGIEDHYQDDIRQYFKWIEAQGKGHSFGAIEDYIQHLIDRGASANTINKRIAALKKRMRQIFQESPLAGSFEEEHKLEGFLRRLKTASVSTMAVDKRKVINEDEYKLLISDELMPAAVKLICKFLWSTGARISEVLNIRIKDCKPQNGITYIRVFGKKRKQRTLRIATNLYNEILEHFKGKKYLFEKSTGGTYRREYVSTRIRHHSMRMIGRSISAHCLRHSFATRTYEKYPSHLVGLSKYLGHSKTSITTDLYVEQTLSDEMLEIT